MDEDSYELCYNAACGCIGHNNYQQALNKLKKAEGMKMCVCACVCLA